MFPCEPVGARLRDANLFDIIATLATLGPPQWSFSVSGRAHSKAGPACVRGPRSFLIAVLLLGLSVTLIYHGRGYRAWPVPGGAAPQASNFAKRLFSASAKVGWAKIPSRRAV